MGSIKIFLALTACFFLSACHITLLETTKCVAGLGLINEELNAGGRIMENDKNELLVEGRASYSSIEPNPFIECIGEARYNCISSKRRYLVIDKAALEKEAERAAGYFGGRLNGQNKYIFVSLRKCTKEVIPGSFEAEDAMPEMIPPGPWKELSDPYEIEIKDKKQEIVLGAPHPFLGPDTYRTHRRWWGYPTLLLLPATIAIDLSSTILFIPAIPVILICR